MAPWIPRIHSVELNDLPWVPGFIRERVQSCLTLMWTFRIPVMQKASPAALVSMQLKHILGPRMGEYTFVDFCAGAGGPTPFIEHELNRLVAQNGKNMDSTSSASSSIALAGSDSLPSEPTERVATPRRSTRSSTRRTTDNITPQSSQGGLTNGASYAEVAASGIVPSKARGIDFVLTDIAPHRSAWAAAAAQSPHLHYIPSSVDAANSSATLLEKVKVSPLAPPGTAQHMQTQQTFRLFSLAFHHMPDPVAKNILRNTLETAGGFGIFELQGRTFTEFVMVLLLGPLLWVLTPFYFWRDPLMLVFMYFVPIVPFILVYDGIISCLRTRVGSEIEALIHASGASTQGWSLQEGSIVHTWPLGHLRYYIGVRE